MDAYIEQKLKMDSWSSHLKDLLRLEVERLALNLDNFNLNQTPPVRLLDYRCLWSDGSFLLVFKNHSDAAYRALMACAAWLRNSQSK